MSRNKCLGVVVVVSMLAAVAGEAWGQCVETQKLLAPDGAMRDDFGWWVAISGDVAMSGAWADDNDNGNDAGSVYVYHRDGSEWSYQAKLTASDGAPGDWFGTAIAISGDVAIVGAYSDDNENGIDAGSAYVFRYVDGTWTEEQKLLASDGAPGDFFNFVAISGDVAIVTAFEDDDSGPGSGSAYVFRYVDGTWTEEQKLLASDGAAGDWFGGRMAISGDVAMVGACWDDNENGIDAGSAYVFRYVDGTWTEEQKLTASDGEAGDFFGTVAIRGDVAFVGAWADHNENGIDVGAAYIFRYVDGAWTEEQKLLASDGAAGDWFGGYGLVSIAVSDNCAIIGAPFHDDNGTDSGSAYVFRWDGTAWNEAAELLASDGALQDQFGWSVAVSGGVAIVGAHYDDDHAFNSGSAYTFDLFSCLCPADLDGSGAVDFGDILDKATSFL